MKSSTAVLSVAALSLAMLTPALGHAQSSQDAQPTGASEAQHMVPARASLTHALDANSTHAGDQFRATLTETVHLNNGVVLHRGDALVGEVSTDDMNTTGKARLAVRFTQVVPKNGQAIPIKATIVALYKPEDLVNSYSESADVPNNWNDGTLTVDELGVVSGVDLHSRIASENSGVFVTTSKNDVKIPAGSEIALAIAANPANSSNPGL